MLSQGDRWIGRILLTELPVTDLLCGEGEDENEFNDCPQDGLCHCDSRGDLGISSETFKDISNVLEEVN